MIAAGVPVAVNSTVAVIPAAVARSLCTPPIGPASHEPTVAIPDAFVVVEPPVMEPEPPVTVKVTVTPAMPAPVSSSTFTDGFTANAVLPAAVWLSPAFFWIDVATGAVAVAVNVTHVETPEAQALTVWVPGVPPRVQLVWAVPEALVVALALTVPPPVAVNVTVAPANAAPCWSRTFTMSGFGSATLMRAVCPLPETAVMLAAFKGSTGESFLQLVAVATSAATRYSKRVCRMSCSS